MSTFNSVDNPVWGLYLEVNNATTHFLSYSLLLMVFIISTYVFIRKTNDIAKSLLNSTHIVTTLTLLLYFAGKISGYVVIDDIFMLGIVVIESMGIAGIYYTKNSQ